MYGRTGVLLRDEQDSNLKKTLYGETDRRLRHRRTYSHDTKVDGARPVEVTVGVTAVLWLVKNENTERTCAGAAAGGRWVRSVSESNVLDTINPCVPTQLQSCFEWFPYFLARCGFSLLLLMHVCLVRVS